MSEKLTSLEGCFGLAEVKIEGSSTRLDHKISSRTGQSFATSASTPSSVSSHCTSPAV